MKELICKITNQKFKDLENKSGSITEHLKKLNINVPTSYIRRQFFKTHGILWHMQYFSVIEVPDLENKICKYCDWKTIDLDNKSGQYTIHLKNKHNKNIKQYINDFPEEQYLFNTYFSKEKYKANTLSSVQNYIKCNICGEAMRKITNTHLLSKHNISLTEYKIKYCNETLSENSLNVFRTIHKNNLKMYESKFTSKGQIEIYEFIKNLGFNCKQNDKKELKGVELDIFIPEKKIAIEYNGLFYHSEIGGKKTRQFHLSKSKIALENNISLIHIFEDDWIQKKDIVKEKLKHALGKNDSIIIGARKCILEQITSIEKKIFLDNNHIQGDDISDIWLGAKFNNELLAVMTFDTKRNMNKTQNNKELVELRRFSTKLNMKVPGIASRLLNMFISKNASKTIISFADRCWTLKEDDNLYTKLGFKITNKIGPDYRYFNAKISRNKRLHKFGFGKNNLKKKFPEIYNDSKSEWEIMQEAGYDRIWDCGKFRYEMEIKNKEQP